jgi:WD40 repeat protein
LNAVTVTEVAILKGHSYARSSAAFSPDGARVLTGSCDKTAKVWEARTGSDVLTLKGHTDEACTASFSPDGARVLTAGEDRTARV